MTTKDFIRQHALVAIIGGILFMLPAFALVGTNNMTIGELYTTIVVVLVGEVLYVHTALLSLQR